MEEQEKTLEQLLSEDQRACKDLRTTPDNITDYCLECPFGFYDENAEEWQCLHPHD